MQLLPFRPQRLGQRSGSTPDQIRDSRQGTAADRKADALLHFARKLVETRGQVSDGDVDAVRQAGFTDGEIAEAVAGMALNIFTNYFNHVAAADIRSRVGGDKRTERVCYTSLDAERLLL